MELYDSFEEAYSSNSPLDAERFGIEIMCMEINGRHMWNKPRRKMKSPETFSTITMELYKGCGLTPPHTLFFGHWLPVLMGHRTVT